MVITRLFQRKFVCNLYSTFKNPLNSNHNKVPNKVNGSYLKNHQTNIYCNLQRLRLPLESSWSYFFAVPPILPSSSFIRLIGKRQYWRWYSQWMHAFPLRNLLCAFGSSANLSGNRLRGSYTTWVPTTCWLSKALATKLLSVTLSFMVINVVFCFVIMIQSWLFTFYFFTEINNGLVLESPINWFILVS